MEKFDFKEKIYQFLLENDKGATASEIAKFIGSNRMTVTKYLGIMKGQDLVKYKGVGMAKLWHIDPTPILNSFDKGENKLMKEVMDILGEGISIMNKDLEIIWYNDKMAEWCGNLKDNKGKHCYEIYQKRKNICPNCPSIKTISSGEIRKAVQPGIDTKGKTRYFDLITAPIKDKKGKVVAVMELVASLNDYKRIMGELRAFLEK
jgi:transcriptional regulator with PAS, ATPase and Fis domain